MNTYESFDAWFDAQSSEFHPLIQRLKQLVEEAAPELQKTSKWGNGCWVKNDLPLIFIHAEPTYLEFGFFAGANLDDPENIFRGNAKFVRHIRIETEKDIDDAAFNSLIEQAVNAPPYK